MPDVTFSDCCRGGGVACEGNAAPGPSSGGCRRTETNQLATTRPSSTSTSTSAPKPPPRRIVGQAIPDSIAKNQALLDAIAILPSNYNFEILKTVHRLRSADVRRVALQFPEGLLMYSCVIADILESFAGVDTAMIMGDVTFGACCVDDFSASALDAEFLVHYGGYCVLSYRICHIISRSHSFADP